MADEETKSDKLEESAPLSPQPKPHYLGHRERLRERFEMGGDKAIPDYELLEMLLFRSIRRGDTKPIAKALMTRFSTFAEVLSAPPERLKEVKGVGDAIAQDLGLIRAAALRLVKGEAVSRPVLASWDAILSYCRAAMAFQDKEQLRLLFLDKKDQLIADEVQQIGTVDHTPVYTREVIKRALELSASGIILTHNHPTGDPTPSISDVDMTHKIIEAGKRMNIQVLDHVIIGRKGHFSFKGQKLI